MSGPKILIVVNEIPFFLSHRLPIAIAARQMGFEVAVAAPAHPDASQFERAGIAFFEMPMPRRIGSLFGEVRAAARLARILRRFRPDAVHLVTSKPIIVGGILCRLFGIPVLAAVSGLGHVFTVDDARSRWVRRAVLAGYRLALKRRRALVIFQNHHNLGIFRNVGIVGDRHVMIRGSGTPLGDFDPVPPSNKEPVVILPARMLWTKGVGEFVEAARLLRARGSKARFVLAGPIYPANPAHIDEQLLKDWTAEGVVEWIGHSSDIPALMKQADLVVLPSYLEGLPKSVIDAAAAGRACVTTDVPGCRDAIIDGETGLLCRVRDAADLAEKIETLLADPQRLLAMGQNARAFAEREFGIERVVDAHLECYAKLAGRPDR